MKTREGDLLALADAGEFDVIIHGCNCQNKMGAGIAKAIKQKFPDAYKADCETAKGDRNKLGRFSYAQIGQLTVVNAYTQFHWQGSGVKADYEAIQSVFHLIKQQFSGKRIGYPLIGAGLARGEWSVIGPIIDEALEGEDHTLVVLPG